MNQNADKSFLHKTIVHSDVHVYDWAHNIFSFDISNLNLDIEKINEIAKWIEEKDRFVDVLWPKSPINGFDLIKNKMNAIEDSILKNVRNLKLYPSDYELGLLAADAYNSRPINETVVPLSGHKFAHSWNVLKVYDYSSKTGLFAVLYVDHKDKFLVLSYRGTSDYKSAKSDVNVVGGLNQIAPEINDCFKVTADAYEAASKLGYFLSITGHSLGGFYAELSAHFVYNEVASLISTEKHLFRTITFDSPGAKEIIVKHTESFQASPFVLDKKKLEVLGVKNYCLGINLINTVNNNVGTTYLGNYLKIIGSFDVSNVQVDPSKEKVSAFRKYVNEFGQKILSFAKEYCDQSIECTNLSKAIFKTYETHKIENILKIFDQDTGKPKPELISVVEKWPKLIDEGQRSSNQQSTIEAIKSFENFITCFEKESIAKVFGCLFGDNDYKIFNLFKSTKHVLDLISKSNVHKETEYNDISQDYKELFEIEQVDNFRLQKYEANKDRFMPDMGYRKWSVDYIIDALIKYYPQKPCNIFEHKVLEKQCNLFLKDTLLLKEKSDSHGDLSVIQTPLGLTPEDVRVWIELLRIFSAYANDKFTQILDDEGINAIIKERFSKFQQLHTVKYIDTVSKIDELRASLTEFYDNRFPRKDYFVCGQSGYGKTSFLASLAEKINDKDSSSLKWWVASDDFARESEHFLNKISASKDKWMSLTVDEFKQDLISEARKFISGANNWIIIIDGLGNDKITDFKELYGPLIEDTDNRFVISSEHCDDFSKLSRLFPRVQTTKNHGIVKRELIKIELKPYGYHEALKMIESMSELTRSFSDSEIEKLIEISHGVPARLAKLLHFLNDNLYLSCGDLDLTYRKLSANHPNPEVWLLIEDSINKRAELHNHIKSQPDLLKFLKQIVVLYRPVKEEAVSEIVFDLEDFSVLDLIPANEVKDCLDFLISKSMLVKIEQSNKFIFHQNIVAEIWYLLDSCDDNSRNEYLSKAISALNNHFPFDDDTTSFKEDKNNVKQYLDEFTPFISAIKDFKDISEADFTNLAELLLKTANALSEYTLYTSMEYLQIAQKYVESKPSKLSIEIWSKAAKYSASLMDYRAALDYSEKALSASEECDVLKSSLAYVSTKVQSLGYNFLANRFNHSKKLAPTLDELLNLGLKSVNEYMSSSNNETSNPAEYRNFLTNINLTMADVFEDVFLNLRNLFGLGIKLLGSQNYSQKLEKLSEILCLSGLRLFDIQQDYKEQGLPLDNQILLTLIKLNSIFADAPAHLPLECKTYAEVNGSSISNSPIGTLPTLFGTRQLTLELCDQILASDIINQISAPKFLELVVKSAISIEDVSLKHLTNSLLGQITNWINYLQNEGRDKFSKDYMSTVAPLIEGGAFWLYEKLKFEAFQCALSDGVTNNAFNDFSYIANVATKMIELSQDLYKESGGPNNLHESFALRIKLWPFINNPYNELASYDEITQGLLPLAEYYFGAMTADSVSLSLKANSLFAGFDRPSEKTMDHIKVFLGLYFDNSQHGDMLGIKVLEVLANGTTSEIFEPLDWSRLVRKLINGASNSLNSVDPKVNDPLLNGHLLYYANSLLEIESNLSLKIALHLGFLKVNEILAQQSNPEIHYLFAQGNILEAKRISEQNGLDSDLQKVLLKNSVLMCANQDNLLFKNLCSAVMINTYKDQPNLLFAAARDLGVDESLFDPDLNYDKLCDSVNFPLLVIAFQANYDKQVSESPDRIFDIDMSDSAYRYAMQTTLVPLEEIS